MLKKYCSYIEEINEEVFLDLLARDESKLLVLYFWDASSKVYESLHSCMEEVSLIYKDSVKVYRMNIGENLQAFEKACCSVYSTVIFFQGGEEVDRCSGIVTKEKINKKINYLLQNKHQV